jgi:hypothetical protein
VTLERPAAEPTTRPPYAPGEHERAYRPRRGYGADVAAHEILIWSDYI